ncbi:uncharacterized protein METZ01_LOCUS435137, partial [marine metagenome]
GRNPPLRSGSCSDWPSIACSASGSAVAT